VVATVDGKPVAFEKPIWAAYALGEPVAEEG
jgi:hypothetical protein